MQIDVYAFTAKRQLNEMQAQSLESIRITLYIFLKQNLFHCLYLKVLTTSYIFLCWMPDT